MKINFSDITLGGTSSYLLQRTQGFSPDLDNINIRVPRSDYTRNIADSIGQRLLILEGQIVGSSNSDWRDKKRNLISKLRNTYTFTITDQYGDPASPTVYDTYEVEGKVVAVEANINPFESVSGYSIQVLLEDPTIFDSTEVSDSITITLDTFGFPFGFSFGFVSPANEIIVTNSGTAPVYPTITLTGPGIDYNISVPTATSSNQGFSYSTTLVEGDTTIITPLPSDPIKVRKNGVSDISNTNFNWEALVVNPGSNSYIFTVSSGANANTTAAISFRPGYLGI